MRAFRLAAAAAAVALLTLPAYGQFNLGGSERDRTRYTPQEKKDEAAAEKAYRDTIKNTRGASGEQHDPWFNVRPSGPSAKAQK